MKGYCLFLLSTGFFKNSQEEGTENHITSKLGNRGGVLYIIYFLEFY
jgi:hypothetical protein